MDPKTQALIQALERQRNNVANLAAQGEAEIVANYEAQLGKLRAELAGKDAKIKDLEAAIAALQAGIPPKAPLPNAGVCNGGDHAGHSAH